MYADSYSMYVNWYAYTTLCGCASPKADGTCKGLVCIQVHVCLLVRSTIRHVGNVLEDANVSTLHPVQK